MELVNEIYGSGFEWGFAQAQNEAPRERVVYPLVVCDFLAKDIALGQTQVSHQSIIARSKTMIRLGKFDENFVTASNLELILKLANMKFVL